MRTLTLFAALSLSGCSVQSLVTDGTYQSAATTSALLSATLVVDLAAKTTSLTVTGASNPVVLQMTALPLEQWKTGCQTMESHVATETFSLTPDPAVLGTLSLAEPRLLAGCGQDTANASEVTLTGTGAPNATGYRLLFQRLTR